MRTSDEDRIKNIELLVGDIDISKAILIGLRSITINLYDGEELLLKKEAAPYFKLHELLIIKSKLERTIEFTKINDISKLNEEEMHQKPERYGPKYTPCDSMDVYGVLCNRAF